MRIKLMYELIYELNLGEVIQKYMYDIRDYKWKLRVYIYYL